MVEDGLMFHIHVSYFGWKKKGIISKQYVYVLGLIYYIAYIIQLFLMYYNVLQFDVQRTTPSPSYLPPSII